MMAIFGAKQPHPQSLTVGGVTSIMDILVPNCTDDPEKLNVLQKIAEAGVRVVLAKPLAETEEAQSVATVEGRNG